MKAQAGALIALMLAGCAVVPRDARPGSAVSRPSAPSPTVRQPVAGTPIAPAPAASGASATTAALAGVVAGPALGTLTIQDASAARALSAFVTSCSAVTRRTDSSGLTLPADWAPACAAARSTAPGEARAFFDRWFDPVQIGDGKAFATGYYEPEIRGSRTRSGPYQTPIYALPKDIIEVDLGLFSDELAERKVRGRVSGNALIPYFDRTEIEEGALAGRGLEIAYAEDPIEFFFLQVQGSGRLRLPDGGVMRIGYAGQNGREYTGIGRLMRDRGLIGPGQASMQGLMAWLRANPAEGRAVMRENKSFVFFRELTGPGPLGALGLPVVGQASVAADPRFVPLGAPVFLSMDRVDATGLWVAQDTGGAIKGANRFDTFWGAGAEARAIAGGMSARGTAFILLPKPAAARLRARPSVPPAP